MKKEGYETRYLLADCTYLYNLILQSLNQFHNKKSFSIRVKNLTVSAEILFYKGLFNHAVKQLQKAEKLAQEVENFSVLLDVLFWQKRCLGYSKGLQKASEVNEKINDILRKINQLQEITNLYYRSYQLHIDKENADFEETVQAFHDLFRQPVLRDEKSIASLTARIYFHLIHGHKYYAENNSKKELGALKKIEDIFRIFPQYPQEHPLDYVSIMDRILNLKKFLDPAGLFDNINTLKQTGFATQYQKSIIEQRIFVITAIHEIEYYLLNHEDGQALRMAKAAEDFISRKDIDIEPFYMIHFYYVCSLVHFKQDNFSKCLDLINYVLNQLTYTDRPAVYCKMEILNMLTHHELGNQALLIPIAKNIQRKYLKKNILLPIEKELVQGFAGYPLHQPEKFILKLNKLYVKHRENVEQNVFSKQYLLDNYLSWIEKRITGKSPATLTIKKRTAHE
jgi:hypothetical protein